MSYSRYNKSISPLGNHEYEYNYNNYWYDECSCCPYGYHIDLDFVRYCESISKEDKNRTGSIKRRKDRRKERQSMEMLLGINIPAKINKSEKEIYLEKSPKTKNEFQLNDDFDNALSDFERALKKSKNKLSNNLPDVTAVSVNFQLLPSSVSTVNKDVNLNKNKSDFDMVSVEGIDTFGLSNSALQNIRQVLALSLDRMKQLEQQVKSIPELQNQLVNLQRENQLLNQQLIKINDVKRKSSPSPTPTTTRKDFSTMCVVLTRNIGVGHQYPNTRHASTITTDFADKWLPEKTKFLIPPQPVSLLAQPKIMHLNKGTQTFFNKEKRDMSMQTSSLDANRNLQTVYAYTQTDPIVKPKVVHTGTMIVTEKNEIGIQNVVDNITVGCSNDTIDSISCDRCNRIDGIYHKQLPVSIEALNNRSKSFNLGDDRLEKKKTYRSTTTQCNFNTLNKYSQCQLIAMHSKSTQHEIRTSEKKVQCVSTATLQLSKYTDTDDITKMLDAVLAEKSTVDKVSAPCKIDAETEISEEDITSKMVESKKNKSTNPSPSKIPIPTTPVEARKFRRQDTYTKIYASSSPTEQLSDSFSTRLSALDLSAKLISNNKNNIDNVKENFNKHLEDDPSSTKPSFTISMQNVSLPISESTIFHPPSENRRKVIPSKEMQGALKVLNDILNKSSTTAASTKNQIINQNAINIVQQEWFKISSLFTANPVDVEDYLDAFENVSSTLLKYVVNIADLSGNTAMHYAVSHGNFDVVSILLDSKVCDINKPNKAGYTSVMLVSLAEVSGEPHANVVKRLFQLADVNIRASQHGQTALMLAVSHGRLDMVKMLLQAGADINIQDEDGSTALMCAAEHGHIEIVKYFLSQSDCHSSITDIDGSTALKIAMEAGHRHIGVLLYAHERNSEKAQSLKLKKTSSISPKNPSSPLPIKSSHRALTDVNK